MSKAEILSNAVTAAVYAMREVANLPQLPDSHSAPLRSFARDLEAAALLPDEAATPAPLVLTHERFEQLPGLMAGVLAEKLERELMGSPKVAELLGQARDVAGALEAAAAAAPAVTVVNNNG